MRDVYVVGVAQTPVTKQSDVRGRYLGAKVVRDALDDAGLDGSRVGALYVGNMMSGMLGRQQQTGGLIADYAGINGVEAATIEAACASGGAAARMGYLTVAGGIHDVVVVCGFERMTHVDHDTVTRALATAADWELEGVCGESFLSLNAKLMRAYMDRYGTQPEQFAPFAINAHRNALANRNALLRKDVDLHDYLESRVIVDPVRLFDASPVCNGAAALILAAAETPGDAAAGPRARVRITGSASATSSLALARRDELLRLEAVEVSTNKAFQQAGISHADIDLFELHDAYTIMSVLSLESAGFAAPGTGTALGTDGRIERGGDLPLSTMGGLKARGHPIGATGVYQLVEAYLQLAGRAGQSQVPDAEVALVQNIGGTGATVVTHVLRRTG